MRYYTERSNHICFTGYVRLVIVSAMNGSGFVQNIKNSKDKTNRM